MKIVNLLKVGVVCSLYLLVSACTGIPAVKSSEESQITDITTVNYPSNKINQFIIDFFSAISDEDSAAYISMWDLNEYENRIKLHVIEGQVGLTEAKVDKKQTRLFATGTIKETLLSLSGSQMFLLETDLNTPAIKLRITKGTDNFYISLLLKRYDDNYAIIDLIDHTIGITQSEKTGFLQSLYYKDVPEEKAVAKRILQATQYMQNGQYLKAKQLLDNLPESYLRNKTILGMNIRVASSLNEKAVLESYKLVERFYSQDPLVSYLIATLYLLQEQPLKAIDELEDFLEVIGPDAELELVISELYLANGNTNQALLHANAALRIDPAFHTTYWLLSRIFIERQDWEAAVLALDVLKERFNFEFKKEYFEEDQNFSLIMQDHSFQEWLATLDS